MREKRAAIGLLALGVVGWAASLYLLVEHIRARVELSLGGACDINATFNCTVAALSPYSQTPGGYPTAALGVAYYFGFIVLSIALLRGAKGLAPVITGLASLASLYSVALLCLSIFQLHTLCPGCSVTYLVNFATLAVCFLSFRPMPALASAPAVIGALAVFTVIILAGTFGFGTWAQGRIAEGVRVAESERATLAVQAAEKNGLSKTEVAQLGHRASAPAVGPNEAPVTISVFSDFECPHCAMFAATLRRLHKNYANNLRVEYRFFPLPGHRWADLAARLGVCANEEGKFWEFHDRVFEKQDKLSDEVLREIVDDLGMNTAKVVSCAELESTKEIVANDLVAGNRLKIEGTPAFVMDGELTTGFQPYDRLEQRIGTLLQSSEHARLTP